MPKLFIIIIFFSFAGRTFAEEKQKKIRVAVMKITSNNCDESTGRFVEDTLSGALFSTKLFTLLEKSQMDRIARTHGFEDFDGNDTKQVAVLGKILSVDKIIVGSVNKFGKFKIEIRSIDVVKASVDYTATEDASELKNIENAVSSIALRIERYYSGYYNLTEKFDMGLTFKNFIPLGDFTSGTDIGYGGVLYFTFNKLFGLNFQILVFIGAEAFTPKLVSIKSIVIIPLEVHLGYQFNLTKNINMIPSIGVGYLFTIMNYDKVGERASGEYQYKVDFFYNPVISARIEFDILLFDRWYLVVAPGYSLFFESKKTGQYIGIELGFRMLF